MYIPIKMKRKVWRSGNSWVITIPTEIVENLRLMEKKLIDFDIKNVFDETEKMFDNFMSDKMFNTEKTKQNFRNPLTDLREANNAFIATIEIPGVDKKDIQLNISENSLEVKVEKKSEMKIADESNGFIRSERFFSNFFRSMNLPSKIIPEKAKAFYKNGILEVMLPKAENNKGNQRRITIE
ncbi:MAG: Hsp20/alpha crystallin family protein [Nanoarchaeota archaeon]